jgi:hypothetical protein
MPEIQFITKNFRRKEIKEVSNCPQTMPQALRGVGYTFVTDEDDSGTGNGTTK